MIGQTVQALVEGDAKRSSDQWMGRTDNNITVIWEKCGTGTRPGDFTPIKISRVSATTLLGDEIPAGSSKTSPTACQNPIGRL